jgi:hypothetical protein
MYVSKESDGTNPQTAFVTRPTKVDESISTILLQQNMTIQQRCDRVKAQAQNIPILGIA